MKVCQLHRRRIKTEAKAKVVASFLREEFIQFLAALAILLGRFELWDELHHDDLKEKDEFISFFKSVLGKIASTTQN